MHPYVPKVLSDPVSGSQMSKAACSSLDETVSGAEWKHLSIPKVLEYLVAESPNFKSLLMEVVRSTGAHCKCCCTYPCQAVTTAVTMHASFMHQVN
jgi:hypothetical protein